MLCKASVKTRPSVLWCYRKDLGFSSHRKKRMKQLQKKMKSGTMDIDEDNPFELFISATNIRYCYYSETHKILGNTFGMCVLQVNMCVCVYTYCCGKKERECVQMGAVMLLDMCLCILYRSRTRDS